MGSIGSVISHHGERSGEHSHPAIPHVDPPPRAGPGARGVRERAHQAAGATPINEPDPGLRHRQAKLSRAGFIARIGALGGAAINANITDEARSGLAGVVL